MHSTTDADFGAWKPRLFELCDEIRRRTRSALLAALEDGDDAIARGASVGAGDVTFGLDLPSEACIDAWLGLEARRSPLSLLTEDRGWRHVGPGRGGGTRELDGFDHGGPRIAIDPVDGTRNLMADLRSAWTVVSFAGPGPAGPRLGDVRAGVLGEIPASRAAGFRRLHAEAGGPCRLDAFAAEDAPAVTRALVADEDDRPDEGYFPFFRYEPALRPALARLEADFFARLAEHEGADLRSCYDDQYISNAGQLVLLSTGTYRMMVDARALLGRRAGRPTVTSKPYDVAGAIVCARAAGAVLLAADGSALDFPIDAETPVDFVGFANAATERRLLPHWLAVLDGCRGAGG